MRSPFRRLIPGAGAVVLTTALLAACNPTSAESSGGPGAEAALAAGAAAAQELPVVTLYKNPTCACCGEWAEHMRENGFRVDVKEAGMNLGQIKAQHGVPISMASCHTALVGDYVLEGHVPADVVQQLLTEQPEIRGLAVPGMPAGVPGMPEAGPDREPYEILAIQPDGSSQVYATR
jgi:hypothetical protein